jgi:integrase
VRREENGLSSNRIKKRWEGIIRDNIMARVDNLRIEEPTINPLSLDEVIKVLECVQPHYRNCLTVLFFTGLRFGEMAALKWKNVQLDMKTAKICETLVYGEEGRTKTKKSNGTSIFYPRPWRH